MGKLFSATNTRSVWILGVTSKPPQSTKLLRPYLVQKEYNIVFLSFSPSYYESFLQFSQIFLFSSFFRNDWCLFKKSEVCVSVKMCLKYAIRFSLSVIKLSAKNRFSP